LRNKPSGYGTSVAAAAGPINKRIFHSNIKLFFCTPNSTLVGDTYSASYFGYLTPGKQPRYPLKRRLGGPQGQSVPFVEQKTLLPVPVFEPRIRQSVARHCTQYALCPKYPSRAQYSDSVSLCLAVSYSLSTEMAVGSMDSSYRASSLRR
jgi:hypothetical protein